MIPTMLSLASFLFFAMPPGDADQDLRPPIRLQADGEPIDIGTLSSIAHAGPWMEDVDGDGDRDLLVGDFPGYFWFFRNVGTEARPEYHSEGKLQAGPEAAKTPVYWCIASSPQFVDYDHDGILDFISGSYDPGDLYLFRGLGHGKYAAVETIRDATGLPLVHHPKERKEYQAFEDPHDEAAIGVRVASFGSWPAMVDWDADGDLDMLIGSFAGKLFLRLNEGTRAEPSFGEDSIAVHADGSPLDVGGHANPVVADWTEDGLWDVVVGAHDGSVSLYENVGTPGEPRLGPRQILVEPKSDSKFLLQYLEPGEAPQPAVRAQICVTDANGDGRLDLIVGDYSDVQPLQALTAEEREEVNQILAETEAAKVPQALKKYQDPKKEPRRMSSIWLYLRRARTE